MWSSLGDVTSKLSACGEKLHSLEAMAAMAMTAVKKFRSVLDPDHVVAKMRLVELENLLARCRQTIATCKEQIEKYANLGSGRLGREARKQMKGDNIDPKLAESLLRQVKTRLSHVQGTLDRFKELGTLEGIKAAEANINTLTGDKQTAQMVSTAARYTKFAFRLAIGAGAVVLLFYCLPAIPGAVATVSQQGLATTVYQVVTSKAAAAFMSKAFLGMLGWGVTEVVSSKIEEAMNHFVSKLNALTQAFMEVFEQLHKVDTTIHGLAELTEPTKGDREVAATAQEHLATNRYERASLQDAIESLLDGLDRLKGQITAGQDS